MSAGDNGESNSFVSSTCWQQRERCVIRVHIDCGVKSVSVVSNKTATAQIWTLRREEELTTTHLPPAPTCPSVTHRDMMTAAVMTPGLHNNEINVNRPIWFHTKCLCVLARVESSEAMAHSTIWLIQRHYTLLWSATAWKPETSEVINSDILLQCYLLLGNFRSNHVIHECRTTKLSRLQFNRAGEAGIYPGQATRAHTPFTRIRNTCKLHPKRH